MNFMIQVLFQIILHSFTYIYIFTNNFIFKRQKSETIIKKEKSLRNKTFMSLLHQAGIYFSVQPNKKILLFQMLREAQ